MFNILNVDTYRNSFFDIFKIKEKCNHIQTVNIVLGTYGRMDGHKRAGFYTALE